MPNLIRGLPIAMSGSWKNGKIVYNNKELKETARVNNEMLNAEIKTYEIPLVLTHTMNADLPLLTNTVMGYVKNMYYKEVMDKGLVYIDVEVLDEFVENFKSTKYRQFSWCRDPKDKRVMHVAVVGKQAIPVANIKNAIVEFMSAEEGDLDVDSLELCTFETSNIKEDKYMESKKISLLDKFFNFFKSEQEQLEKEELSASQNNDIETLSDDAQTETGENGDEQNKNKEDEHIVEEKEELSKQDEKDSSLEYLAEMEKKFEEKLSAALTKQQEELSSQWGEKLESMSKKLQEKEDAISNDNMEKFIHEMLSAGKITPASIEKLKALYDHVGKDEKAVNLLQDFLQENEFLSFDEDAIIDLLKMSPRKSVEKESNDEVDEIYKKLQKESEEQAKSFVQAHR